MLKITYSVINAWQLVYTSKQNFVNWASLTEKISSRWSDHAAKNDSHRDP